MTIEATPTDQETSSQMEHLLTVDDVAEYLRLNPETIRVMARKGELPSIKVGKRVWRFKSDEIALWVNQQHSLSHTGG